LSRLDQAEQFLARKLSSGGQFTYQQLEEEGHFQFWELMEAWYRMRVKGTRPDKGNIDWFNPTTVPEGDALKFKAKKEYQRKDVKEEAKPYLPLWMRYGRE
jgi:hypothetical protein